MHGWILCDFDWANHGVFLCEADNQWTKIFHRVENTVLNQIDLRIVRICMFVLWDLVSVCLHFPAIIPFHGLVPPPCLGAGKRVSRGRVLCLPRLQSRGWVKGWCSDQRAEELFPKLITSYHYLEMQRNACQEILDKRWLNLIVCVFESFKTRSYAPAVSFYLKCRPD